MLPRDDREPGNDQPRDETRVRDEPPPRSALRVERQRVRLAGNPARRRERRQHPARHESRHADAHYGQHAQLREALKARQRHRRGAEHGREHGKPQRRADPRHRVGEPLPARGLDERVARVVHRLADQGGAETERDAVHRPEHPADGGDAREDARGDRERAQDDRRERAIDREQQRQHQHGGSRGKPARLGLDGGARGDSENAGPRQEQPRLPCSPSAENARRMASIACAWRSRSNPGASVSATSSALDPSRENHTPSRSPGPPSATSSSMTWRASPVGSCGRLLRMNGAAGDASSARLSLSAADRPSGVNRSAVTAGLRR